MRADGLGDVARADDGTAAGQARGDGGQPVLLAAVDVDDVGGGDGRAQPAHVGEVGARPHAARELEHRHPLHAFLTGAVDHRPLGAAPAAERDCVAAAL